MDSRTLRKRNPVPSVLVSLFLVGAVLCSSVLASCGASSAPASQTYPYKPFLAWHTCGDNTFSFPVQFLQQGAQNIADRIDSYISPNMGGMFVDFSLVEKNSLQASYVSFSTPAIQNIPPKPQPGNSPYAYKKALQDWLKTVAAVNALVASVRASIKPALDKMRSPRLAEVNGTDEFGCADAAAAEFSHFTSGIKILTYISDMQNNIDVNFSKHINLLGAKVRVIFMPCQVQSACEQLKSYWAKQFKAWGASSVEFFTPAESEAEKITF